MLPVVTDATSESDTRRLFGAAGDDLDLAIYNAGNNTPGMTCSGWRSRHRSCGPSAQFHRSGIAKFVVNVCSPDTTKRTAAVSYTEFGTLCFRELLRVFSMRRENFSKKSGIELRM
ncbi:hypothetical protein [Bradyrhizobium centrolobii]|uniref:hypothetical protein n=1 Tax=Bradyrhizobium centrolobii TaxID=1505087 RepID=UPI0010A96981|nr:hypothetical protein [Bradyrhizobium centrolobii]